jgi:ketopantoate reductase
LSAWARLCNCVHSACAVHLVLTHGLDRHWEMVRWLPSAGQSLMLQDLIAGRRLEEVEALNGAVPRQSEQAGVATPLNLAVYAAFKPYADGPPTLPG